MPRSGFLALPARAARKVRVVTDLARWRMHEALAPPRHVDVRGLRFTLRCRNWITHFRAETFATKEPETLDWIDTHVRSDDVLFDIGGNIGLFALYAARRHIRGRVIAFEPEYANLHLLRDNIAANGLGDRIQVYPIALSDRTGLSQLHVQDLTPGAALHSEGVGEVAATESGRPVVASEGTWAMKLDDFCEQLGFYPNTIKIDVDGGEHRVLAGASQTLSRQGLRSLIVEGGDGGLPQETRALLYCAGLKRMDPQPPSESGNEIWVR